MVLPTTNSDNGANQAFGLLPQSDAPCQRVTSVTDKTQTNLRANSGQSILILAALVIILAGIKAASALFVPFLLAAFISLIAATPLTWMIRRGVPNTWAALLSVIFVLLTLFFLAAIIGASLGDFTRLLPDYEDKLQAFAKNVLVLLKDYGMAMPDSTLTEIFNPAAVMRYVTNTFSTLSAVLSNGFLILLLIIFILLEASHVPDKLKLLFKTSDQALEQFAKFQENLNKYLAIKTTISLATGLSVWLMLSVLNVDFPLLWALLAFMLNYIPNIGSLIAAIPPTLLVLVDSGLVASGIVILGYFVINNIYGNFIEPRLMGRGLGLSTLVVFLSLIFWGWLLGPVGMLLSIPLTMMFKIGLEMKENTRWLAILLSDHRQVAELAAAEAKPDQEAQELPPS